MGVRRHGFKAGRAQDAVRGCADFMVLGFAGGLKRAGDGLLIPLRLPTAPLPLFFTPSIFFFLFLLLSGLLGFNLFISCIFLSSIIQPEFFFPPPHFAKK